ncbi:MAG: hypothetical protein HYU43_08650, partial [Armatimonadetes bacterium]|nr:hypothetical protein [Armatimonadota bacterium]
MEVRATHTGSRAGASPVTTRISLRAAALAMGQNFIIPRQIVANFALQIEALAGAPFWAALLGGMAGAAVLGLVIERVAFRPV